MLVIGGVGFVAACLLAGCSTAPPGNPEPTEADTVAVPSDRSEVVVPSSSPVAGSLLSTGLNFSGQLGRPAGESSPEFGEVGLPRGSSVVAVAGGGRHSLAVLQDGRVLSWGANDEGQLGRPATAVIGHVEAPDGADGVLTDVVAVSADTDFSMALRKDGTVVTWGRGDAGQRGIGSLGAPAFPTVVRGPDGATPLRDVVQIAADGRTEFALLRDGTVVSWGANRYGMIGDGTVVDRHLPVQVKSADGGSPLTGVRQVVVGGQTGVALLESGEVLTWGRNDEGQLGDGTRIDRHLPGAVRDAGGGAALSGIVQIAAAEKHAFALRENGTVLAWGNNSAGQLGDGTIRDRLTPVPVVNAGAGRLLQGVRAVVAGEAYGVAILDDGTVRTWGANGGGQLGAGDRVPRSRPGPVVGAGGSHIQGVVAVGAGERHNLLVVRQ